MVGLIYRSHSDGLPSGGADPSLHKPRPPLASGPCGWEEVSASFRAAQCRGLPGWSENYGSRSEGVSGGISRTLATSRRLSGSASPEAPVPSQRPLAEDCHGVGAG